MVVELAEEKWKHRRQLFPIWQWILEKQLSLLMAEAESMVVAEEMEPPALFQDRHPEDGEQFLWKSFAVYSSPQVLKEIVRLSLLRKQLLKSAEPVSVQYSWVPPGCVYLKMCQGVEY
jgi:hypothetical protein